jgi:DNA-binding response OmpR family regulator
MSQNGNNCTHTATAEKRLLFLDDDVPLRVTLGLYFKMKGIKVVAAEDSAHALSLASKERFDLAILDVRMGEESGLDVLDKLVATKPELPVIMFTSSGNDPVLADDCLKRGARGCVSKEDSIDKLYQRVSALTV